MSSLPKGISTSHRQIGAIDSRPICMADHKTCHSEICPPKKCRAEWRAGAVITTVQFSNSSVQQKGSRREPRTAQQTTRRRRLYTADSLGVGTCPQEILKSSVYCDPDRYCAVDVSRPSSSGANRVPGPNILIPVGKVPGHLKEQRPVNPRQATRSPRTAL